jgi:hypothetical protein
MNAITPIKATEIVEAVIARGDLKALTPRERAKYYVRTCESLGLNPLTRPFEYLELNGKLTLYARRDCADQLRRRYRVSLSIVSREIVDDILTVHVRATMPPTAAEPERADEEFGALCMVYPPTKWERGHEVPHPQAGKPLVREDRANAIMKGITKAKRRATLSICGLGWLDETEVGDMPSATPWCWPRPTSKPLWQRSPTTRRRCHRR